jgi:ABC-type nitrate/sulfonate/bicarbonate transport system ATPase subunit
MRVVSEGAALAQLRGADLELEPGRYVVLSSEGDALASLITVLAGRERPRAGQVLVDGLAPAARPEARRKIAALFSEEVLPPAKTVEASVAKALAARGAAAGGARALLTDSGLAPFAGMALALLGPREARSVALALALAHDSAEFFALHEPLATLLTSTFVLAALDRHTARGAVVLTTTTSPADATALGGRWLCVELGRVRSREAATPRLGAGPWQQVLVETSDARALSQVLHESSLGLSTELGSSPHALKVSGPALDVTVHELVTVARKHNLEIHRIEAAVPPVEALMAARAGFARGAYEAARAAALGAAAPAASAVRAPPQQIIQLGPESPFPPESP